MERINLKELKEALNKLPEDTLEKFYLTHGMATESPEAKLQIIWFADEEDQEECENLYKMKEYAILEKFANAVWEDAKKCVICLIDEDKMEDYAEDCD